MPVRSDDHTKAGSCLQEVQVVRQVHPGAGGFRQQGAFGQRLRIDEHQIQALLIARQALERDRSTVRGPGDTRQVDIRIVPQPQPARAAAVRDTTPNCTTTFGSPAAG